MRVRSDLVSLMILALVPTRAANAETEETNLFADTFYVSLGTFIVGTDTKIRVNGQGTIGDEIDLEETFGDTDRKRFRLDGYWRFADRHKLRFLWFQRGVKATETLDDEIEFEGNAYPVGAKVELSNDFSVYELAYEYVILRRPKFEFTGSVGVHYAEFAVELNGEVNVGEGEIDAPGLRNTASVNAPLPVLGVRGLWYVGHDLWLDASAQYFALKIGSYDGNLQDYRGAIVWQPKSYAGIGFGYNAFRVNVNLDKSDYRGSLDWTYYGPQVFFSASF